MMLEIAACLVTALCIFLAGRNNIHTWWVGIVGCVLFGIVFYQNQLYADVTLQVFFVVTGIIGWWNWYEGNRQRVGVYNPKLKEAPPSSMMAQANTKLMFAGMIVVALGTAFVYGAILHAFTDAYAPHIDSLVLTLSVLGQLLLMRRSIETWPVWLVVNILSVPLYFSRELYLTAGLYTFCLFNAIYSWYNWHNLIKAK